MKKQTFYKFFLQGAQIICGLFFAQNLCGATAKAEVKEEIPAAFLPERYTQMTSKSPFALATPVTPTIQSPSFAANLYVSGIAKIGEADYVSIASRDQQAARFSLLIGETGTNDISLVRIEWSDQLGKSKVLLKKGNDVAVLEFDQITIMQAPPVQQQQQPALPPVMPHLPQPPQQGDNRRIVLPGQPNINPSAIGRPRSRIINNKP